MGLFKHDARVFKFDILREVAKEVFEDRLSEDNIQNYISEKLIPGSKANYRCCVYKEKEVLRQRARLSMGKMANDRVDYQPRQIVQVINAACDGCSIRKILVTNNCRKCMAKSCMSACRFQAITMGGDRAVINYDKCRECGLCAKSCPYSAIVVTERPCKAACPVDAISYDEHGLAIIDEEKCINCGRCQAACPFGAIEDISWIVPVAENLKLGKKMAAIVAPAIQGQFDSANIAQIKEGIRKLGFDIVVEAAVGADAVAYYEHEELKEFMEEGKPMTTSCCPAFVNMAKMHFPDVYENNVSSMASPMVVTASMIKREHPDYEVVFVGPCLAKKQEAMGDDVDVDYVLTFEEMAALLVAKHIYLSEIKVEDSDVPTNFARNFAQGGGVGKAVVQIQKEKEDENFTAFYADGAFECKKALLQIKAGKFTYNILEGMCCDGGCINGPCTIADPNVAKAKMFKENMNNKQTIHESLDKFKITVDNVTLHRHK